MAEGSMAVRIAAAIERPNSRHRRGIWAYMDKDNRTIKDTYRPHNPRPWMV